MNTYSSALCALIVLFSFDSAFAMAEEQPIENVLVTGSRLTVSQANLPLNTTVITRETIEASSSPSILDLLRQVSGLHVSQYGGRGGASSVFIQGAEPNFTVVMIDGLKVNDPNNSRGGSFDFATLNLAEVERIEIARGAQSSIYGSDGLSGSINIISRDATSEAEAAVELELGEQGFHRTSLYASKPITEQHTFSVSLSTTDDGDGVQGNAFENDTAGVRLRGTGALDYDVTARWAEADARSFPEDSGGPTLAQLRELEKRNHSQASIAGQAHWQPKDQLEIVFLSNFLDQDEQIDSPGIAPGVRSGVPATQSKANLRRLQLGSHAIFSYATDYSFTVGADYQKEKGEQIGSVEFAPGFELPTDFMLTRETVGIFAEARYQATHQTTLSASLRRDDPTGHTPKITGRLGLEYTSGNSRIYAAWGEGFKLPSFFALGHALVGNPDLKPETSRNWSLGIDHKVSEHLQFSLNGFHNSFQDLIDFDFDLFTNVNRSEVQSRGLEFSTNWQIQEKFNVAAHATYVDVDIRSSQDKLRQRPDWRGGVSLNWHPLAKVSLQLHWLYVDGFFDSAVPTGGVNLDGYSKLDASLHWEPNDAVSLWLAVDNASDEQYFESVGFEAVGIRTRLGLKWQL